MRSTIELFLEWLKPHLRIKAFTGSSANAASIQIWTAVSVQVLVAIVKKRAWPPTAALDNSTDSERNSL
jgi:hypothetical protein